LLTRGLASLEFNTPFSDFNICGAVFGQTLLLATGVALFSSLVAVISRPGRGAAAFRRHHPGRE